MVSYSYVWWLVFLRLGVRDSYVWGLVFLRLEVRDSYVCGRSFVKGNQGIVCCDVFINF